MNDVFRWLLIENKTVITCFSRHQRLSSLSRVEPDDFSLLLLTLLYLMQKPPSQHMKGVFLLFIASDHREEIVISMHIFCFDILLVQS